VRRVKVDPKELLANVDAGQHSQRSNTEFDSYCSLADSDIRIIVAKDVAPPFQFTAGGWEALQLSSGVGPKTQARISGKGFSCFA
jgi:hypothetical protein